MKKLIALLALLLPLSLFAAYPSFQDMTNYVKQIAFGTNNIPIGVYSLDNLSNSVVLVVGTNMTLTTNGNTLTLSSTASGSGGGGTNYNFSPNNFYVTQGTNVFLQYGGVDKTNLNFSTSDYVTNNDTRAININGPFTIGGINVVTNAGRSSSFRYITQSAPSNGDTNYFGPFTPGTQTAGFQEAINSLPNAVPLASQSQTPGGGMIFVGPGEYDTFTNIYTPNTTNPFTLSIFGSGMTASAIVYKGTVPMTVLTIGNATTDSSKGRFTSANFYMLNMCVASSTNACTNIVWLNGGNGLKGDTYGQLLGSAFIQYCALGNWYDLTNSMNGVLSISGNASNHKHNLLALNVESYYGNVMTLCDSYLIGAGVSMAADHQTLYDCTFQGCSTTSTSPTNDWPTNCPFAVGAAVTFPDAYNGNDRWIIQFNHFVGCGVCYLFADTRAADNNGYGWFHPELWNDLLEGSGAPARNNGWFGAYVVTTDNGVTSIDPLSSYSTPQGYFNQNSYIMTNIGSGNYDYSKWGQCLDTSNFVNIVSLHAGQVPKTQTALRTYPPTYTDVGTSNVLFSWCSNNVLQTSAPTNYYQYYDVHTNLTTSYHIP